MKVIEINNLRFNFMHQNGENPFRLSVPEFMVDEGEFISILGPNGCGKSTLLRLISNLLLKEEGEIKIFDKPIQHISLKELARYISYVPQTNRSVFPYSVYEIVMMGRTPYLNMLGFESGSDREIVMDSLKQMQVNHLMKKGINELSGGEAQRVFIARALAQKARIILLDEPNAHMDIEHQIMIFEMLKRINREEGITVITVSHDLNLVGIYLNRTVVMKNGSIVFDGDKKSVLTQKRIKEVFNVDVNVFENSGESFNILVKPVSE